MSPVLYDDAIWKRFLGSLQDYAIIILDRQGNIVGWNEGARMMKGYSSDEIIGEHFSILYTPEARVTGHPDHELELATSVGRYEEEGWRVRKSGTLFWAHVTIVAIRDENDALQGFGKVVRDFTQRKLAEEQSANTVRLLEHTADTDYLTGLNNRRSLDKALAVSVSSARRHNRTFSLAVIDLDRFKSYNDELGHQAGDSYLKQAAGAWRATLRSEDVIARYGGEEFVIILPETVADQGVACIERLRASTPRPLTCSAGLAEWDGVELPNTLIDRADRALYQAKNTGRDRLVVASRQQTQLPTDPSPG